jgi:hypothetical protein
LLERSDAQIMGGSRSQEDTEKLLNVEEVEKYDDQDWMQKWGSCDEEVLIEEEEEEGRNFMQRNLDAPRVREEVILGIDDILGSSKGLFIGMSEGGNPDLWKCWIHGRSLGHKVKRK